MYVSCPPYNVYHDLPYKDCKIICVPVDVETFTFLRESRPGWSLACYSLEDFALGLDIYEGSLCGNHGTELVRDVT